MRLTLAQIGVRLICGIGLPTRRNQSIREKIQEGHRILVRITGEDFGYDLQAWHEYLKESRQGGYTYGRNIVLPKIMQAALKSPEWQSTVESITDGNST